MVEEAQARWDRVSDKSQFFALVGPARHVEWVSTYGGTDGSTGG